MENSKSFFPFAFNIPEHYEYEGDYPSADYYTNFGDTASTIQEKKNFIKQKQDQGAKFNFKNEIHYYGCLDTDIITQAMVRFLKGTFELQTIILSQCHHIPDINEDKELPLIHPFEL